MINIQSELLCNSEDCTFHVRHDRSSCLYLISMEVALCCDRGLRAPVCRFYSVIIFVVDACDCCHLNGYDVKLFLIAI